MLSDVARPRHTDPLTRPQLGQSDGRDVGGRHQTRPQVQLAADPELVHHAHYLENYHNLLTRCGGFISFNQIKIIGISYLSQQDSRLWRHHITLACLLPLLLLISKTFVSCCLSIVKL